MRITVVLMWILSVFFVLSAVAYSWWTAYDTLDYGVEWVGAVALTLCAVLAAFIGFFLSRVHKAQGGALPEDRLDANIDDGDPELGFFSPWSWWPIALAGGAALAMVGLAVGFWLVFIAVPIVFVCIVGWVYEYYRGNFAR